MGWELYSLSEGKISHRNRNLTRGPSTQAQVEHAELIYRHLRLKKKTVPLSSTSGSTSHNHSSHCHLESWLHHPWLINLWCMECDIFNMSQLIGAEWGVASQPHTRNLCGCPLASPPRTELMKKYLSQTSEYSALDCIFFGLRNGCTSIRWLSCTLTQLFLPGSFFYKCDPLQDSPKEHAQGEDVCLSCVGESTPHLRSHVEVRAAGGGEALPGQVPFGHTFAHFAQTEVCHLQHKSEISPEHLATD